MLRHGVERRWWKQPRRPLQTLPGMAAAPVLLGPALTVGGFLGILRDGETAAVVGDIIAFLGGLMTVALVVLYVLRPSNQSKASTAGRCRSAARERSADNRDHAAKSGLRERLREATSRS